MKVKLGEVADQIRGVTYKSQDVEETLNTSSITLLRANNISNNGVINYDDVVYIKKNKVDSIQLIKINDILVCASSGSVNLVGKAAQIKEDKLLSFGAFCKVIRPKNIHAIYLGYFFQSPYYRKTISSLAQGANINNIRNDDIDNLMVNIYDDIKTKEIVAVLDKVTLLISMRKEQLEKLDILVKSKFIEMFGDPVLNPKGWEKKKGNKLFNFTNGRFLNTNNRRESGIPVYGGNGVAWYTNEYFISFPTIIIGRVGEKCGNIHYSTGPIWVTDNAIYISQFLQNIFNLIYLSYEMDLLNFRSMAEGGGQPKITQKILNDCFYRVPPLELQNQFAEFVEQVEKNKEKIKSSLNQLETLYSALMQEYFG